MKTCGIYKITNPKGKVYIGQSVNCETRKSAYKTLHCKAQTRLYRSILKYGWEAHKFEVIHPCKPEELDGLEIYYIGLYQCFDSEHGLNLKNGGAHGTHSVETKEKIKEKRKLQITTEETKRKMSERMKGEKNPNWGRKFSDEFKRKISISQTGPRNHNFGKPRSRNTILKISESNSKTKRSQGKIVINLETGIFYNSPIEAAESINMKPKNLWRQLLGRNGVSIVKNHTSFIYA